MEQIDVLKEILEKDKNNFTLKEIASVFVVVFDGYQKKSKTCSIVKSKITKGEWNSLVNGITTSFLLSLHTSKLPAEEAMKYNNIDGLIGIGVLTKKDVN